MAKEQGTTGLLAFNGILNEEFLRELRGKEGYKRFDEMRRNSPIIGAMLYYHEQAIRKVSWNFSGGEVDGDPRIDFLNDCREYMSQSWNDFISEALTFLTFGYSLFYVNRRRDKETNLWMWDSFSPRKQSTVFKWLLNYPGTEYYDANKRNGEILGFVQQAPPAYTLDTIMIDKVIHFRTRVESNNPEGISLLRNAWIPYYYAKNIQAYEAIGFERDANGMPVITLPQAASVDEADSGSDAYKAATIVRNIRNDEQAGVVLPFGYTLNLLSGAGKSFADMGRAIERYESRMLMAMLSQFIMLGQNSVGSLALSQDATNIAEMVVNATADIIAETFTKQEIPRILALNGWEADDICLEHTPAGDTDLTMFSNFLQAIGDKITWTADDEQFIRQMAGLPERDTEDIQMDMDAKKEMAQTIGGKTIMPTMPKEKPSDPTKQETADTETEAEADYSVSLFGIGDPLDKRARTRAENQWRAAMETFLEKQRKRVLKAARQMKGE